MYCVHPADPCPYGGWRNGDRCEGMQEYCPPKGGTVPLDGFVMKLPFGGWYQPGDTWDPYVGATSEMTRPRLQNGGAHPNSQPKLVLATYAGYKKAGPLLVRLDHRGTWTDGKPVRLTPLGWSVQADRIR